MKKSKEIKLFFIFAISFILLVISKFEFNTLFFIKNTLLEEVLISKGFKDIFDGVLIGLVSAYIFYVFLDFIPRKRKEQDIENTLSYLVASVISPYKDFDLYGHERPIYRLDKSCLDRKWMLGELEELKLDNRDYLSLKFAMEAAHSRLEDFRNVLPLAMELSPQHALSWLALTDKVRIFAENHEEIPEIEENEIYLLNEKGSWHPIRLFKLTLAQRFKEYVEQSLIWLNIGEENHK